MMINILFFLFLFLLRSPHVCSLVFFFFCKIILNSDPLSYQCLSDGAVVKWNKETPAIGCQANSLVLYYNIRCLLRAENKFFHFVRLKGLQNAIEMSVSQGWHFWMFTILHSEFSNNLFYLKNFDSNGINFFY